MKCVVCGTPVPHRLVGVEGMHPWCSEPCGVKWRTRNNFLFDLTGKASITREQILGLVVQKGYLDNDVPTLGRLSRVSTTIRPLAKEHELGSAFHKTAVHQQQKGMKDVSTTTMTQVKTGKKIQIEKTSVKGTTFKRTVDEVISVPKVTKKSVPNIVKVDITADQMLEIALMAYNTAIELKSKGLPVILYRVDSKGSLTGKEKNEQTLSSSVHASVGSTEVWPLEKTAAWIQGAMRARVSFVLLNDPRGADILIGGVNKRSDAVYVRELHQITSMKYQIKVAPDTLTPTGMRGKKKLFILIPPEKTLGVMPLVPRITADIWSHTWDSSKSNLTLADSEVLIRDHLRKLFTDAGKSLPLEAY
jgi:hypothetical protein